MMTGKTILLFFVLAFVVTACSNEGSEPTAAPALAGAPTMAAPTEITLMTHDSFDASESVLAEFEQTHNAKIVLLPAGDAGAALNQAILAKDNPLADVFFGVDNTFLGRALAAGIFEPYQSPVLTDVPDALELDSSHELLPVDFGYVCLNYDEAWFAEKGLPPPQSLIDLADPAYKGLLVVENPATSSPGLAFLLATVATFGETDDYTYLNYWADLRANDVLVTDGWEDAYWGRFTAASDGARPLVVSYASSPPAEVVFADPPIAEPPTATIVSPGSCFHQVEFVGILKGTPQRELAGALVDFLLSKSFQEDIPLKMFVYPANETAALPDVFVRWAPVPAEPATLDPTAIDAHREAWIEAWTEVVLR
ncbi:MAG: thiamine ABC transporter substrate-binding protein [Chloroflexota bacterium]